MARRIKKHYGMRSHWSHAHLICRANVSRETAITLTHRKATPPFSTVTGNGSLQLGEGE